MIIKHETRQIPREEWHVTAFPLNWRDGTFNFAYSEGNPTSEAQATAIARNLSQRFSPANYRIEIRHTTIEITDDERGECPK